MLRELPETLTEEFALASYPGRNCGGQGWGTQAFVVMPEVT